MAHAITKRRRMLGSAIVSGLILAATIGVSGVSQAQIRVTDPTGRFDVDIGQGRLVELPEPIADVFISDPAIADVRLESPRRLYIIGKANGTTSFYTTNAGGKIVYSANIFVRGRNIDIGSVDQMLNLAMPDADIKVARSGDFYLLTGTIADPADIAEAESLVTAYLGQGARVVSRLKTATPLQVNLRVRFAEVSRSLAKEITGNVINRDTSGGFLFGLQRSNRAFATIGDLNTSNLPTLDASASFGLPPGSLSLPFDPATGQFVTGGTSFNFTNPTGLTTIQAAGRLFGLDIASALDLSERLGLSTTLAEPNLTTISGETASFQAGGRFPIPVSQGLGSVAVSYENFGISLTYTPTVLANGRISIRVAPEVSELSSAGAVRLNGFEIPAVSTRSAQTTVELGSGESFMIAGLLQNSYSTSVDKTPGLSDVPVLGALFKSDGWRRNETELMIVITPYLVNPVSDSEIVLPTDGFEWAGDAEKVLGNSLHAGKSGGDRAKPSVSDVPAGGPQLSGVQAPAAPAQPSQPRSATKSKKGNAGPGFSFD
jgi:pilus assembly protein CpaC